MSEDAQDGALLYFERPLVVLQIVGAHKFVKTLLDMLLFFEADQKPTQKVVILFLV